MSKRILSGMMLILLGMLISGLGISIPLYSLERQSLYDFDIPLVTDSIEYGGWMDAKSIYVDSNSTHLTFILDHYGNLPHSSNYRWRSEFYLDVDQSDETGGTYWGDIGADYTVKVYGVGDGSWDLTYLGVWNETEGWFEWTYPDELTSVFSVDGNYLGVTCPFELVGVTPESTFDLVAEGNSYLVDEIAYVFTYETGNTTGIVIDGEPADWAGTSPVFSDPGGEVSPSEFDWMDFYMTDNSSWLFHRFDVNDTTKKSLELGNAGIYRDIPVYYDTDQNSSTGYGEGGIGAEYVCRAVFTLYSDSYPVYGPTRAYFGQWNASKEEFEWIRSGSFGDWNSTFEWGVPLSDINVTLGSNIDIYVSQPQNTVLDTLPDSGHVSYPHQWPMFHGDLQHTGHKVESVIPPLEPIWRVWVGAHVESASPAIKDGILYIGGSSRVWALNATTGSIVWQSPSIGQKIKTTPSVDDKMVYVAAWNTTYALSRSDGTIKWKFISQHENLSHWGFFIDSSPMIFNGTVYVGLNDGYLYAINASTGLKIWEFRTGAAIKCTPAIYDGKVFFGSGHGRPPHDYNFYALDAERGMLMWKKTLAYDTISSAAIRDGIVYVGSGQWVYALNASDGREVWVYQLPDGNIIESSPAVTPTKVYITGGNWSTWETIGPTGSLYALNRTTGQLIWTVGTTFTRISPSVAGSTVYLGTYNTTKLTAPKNYFYALDGDTGAILWNHPLQYISTSIPAIVEGIVYFAAEGYIYAFRSIEAIVSIETDKTSYTPGETVEVSLTVVNPAGTSFPSSKVTAKITWPTGDGVTIFDSGPFTLPPKFNRTVTGKLSIPDSIFVPDGTYTFTATLTYNGNTATDTASFEIRRSTRNATRWEFDRS